MLRLQARDPDPAPRSPCPTIACAGDKCTGCSWFYWCYSGGAVRQQCPGGTTMDSRNVKSYCDWPSSNVC
jgi:hypothetical protein